VIKIQKPAKPPRILDGRGWEQTAADGAAYDGSPTAYDSGEKVFKFDSGIYGAASVKRALIKAQHGKCGFCESKVEHIAYGDVEHYRPKAGFRQTADEPLGRPGYYWCAYAWENLLYACQLCNQRFKKNLFPLRDPAKRARSHRDDVSQEEPLLINPADADPAEFIGFREEIPYAIDDNPSGRATIAALGLDREALNERRRDKLGMLKALRVVASLDLAEARDARDLLDQAVLPSAEYAAMARAALATAPSSRDGGQS